MGESSCVLLIKRKAHPFKDCWAIPGGFVGPNEARQYEEESNIRDEELTANDFNYVVSIYQWLTLGNMSLVALYIAFLINTVYGFINWTKLQKPVNQENSADKVLLSNI